MNGYKELISWHNLLVKQLPMCVPNNTTVVLSKNQNQVLLSYLCRNKIAEFEVSGSATLQSVSPSNVVGEGSLAGSTSSKSQTDRLLNQTDQ